MSIAASEAQPVTPARSRVRKFFLLAGIAVLLVLFLEGAVRIRQLVRYGSARADLFETRIDPVSGLLVAAPNQATLHIRTESHGFRSPELAMPKPPGTLRIAFLGESTTFSAVSSSNETTWPYLTWEALQKKWPAKHVDFLNAAGAGYLVADSGKMFQYHVAETQPDVVIIQHASMDLYADTEKLARDQGVFTGKIKSSKLSRYSVLWGLLEHNLQIQLRLRTARWSKKVQVDDKTVAAGFEQRLRQLVQQAQQRGGLVVLVTYPHKARREQPAEVQLENWSGSLYYAPWMSPALLTECIEAYSRAVREVAQQTGAVLADVEFAIPDTSEYFQDSVHYKDIGSALMADKVSDAIARSAQASQLLSGERSAAKNTFDAASPIKTESR